MIRVTFEPGHLSRGGELLFALKIRHEGCSVCREPFEGVRNQEICDTCRVTPAGKQFIRDRAKRVRARHRARRKGFAVKSTTKGNE